MTDHPVNVQPVSGGWECRTCGARVRYRDGAFHHFTKRNPEPVHLLHDADGYPLCWRKPEPRTFFGTPDREVATCLACLDKDMNQDLYPGG